MTRVTVHLHAIVERIILKPRIVRKGHVKLLLGSDLQIHVENYLRDGSID